MAKPTRDIFVCHASEDKGDVVRRLAEAFTAVGVSCWYDEAEIQWGDSIPNSSLWFSVWHLCGKTGRKEN